MTGLDLYGWSFAVQWFCAGVLATLIVLLVIYAIKLIRLWRQL